MGGNERYLEVYYPQLCKSLDLFVPKDTTIGRLAEAAAGELGLYGVDCIMLSYVRERLLAPVRTLEEEGIGSGDKLIVLYKYKKEQRRDYVRAAGINGGVYADESGYAPDGEADS